MHIRWWGHTIFAAGYCSVAALTVLLLLVLRPLTDRVVVVLAGVVVVLGGGLIHEVVIRRANEQKLAERQLRLRQAYEDLVDMFLKMKGAKPKTAAAKAEAEAGVVGAPSAPDVAGQPAPSAAAVPAESPPEPSRKPAPRMARLQAPPPLSPAEAETAAVIRAALAEERVEAFLQPIVGLPGRKPRFFEVLSRIRLPNDSLLLPHQYLTVAEHEKLMPPIDEVCLARAAGMIRETNRHKHAIGFFCNISAQTLGAVPFLERFLGGGGDSHGLRNKLVIEMSQRDLTAEMASSMSAVSELVAIGFQFSMDRIESLDIDISTLFKHNLQFVKLNCGLFIQPETRNAARSLKQRLQEQSISVIIEKVETERQLLDLEELGLELVQGFLFGEPRLSRRTS